MVEAGTVIDGRYRVISRLGSGGMADVYLAEDELLGRQVAVKLLHHHFAEDQEFVERFRREASSAAALSHQNIVAIFDRGSWEGTYYIAMEYVAGRSLKSIVREQGPLEPAAAIDIVVQILRAARFAHKRGVIHRDLKPHNVILDEEGRARVTDFGIARAGASDMTLTGSIMGTAQYLSPEQAQGHVVSEASDLYSIGVIFYELLTGTVPFEGETAVAIAFKQVAADPAPPSAVNPAVPPALDAVVLRALAKDPAARYTDADEFIAVLLRERAALPAQAVPAGAWAAGAAAAAAAAAGVGGRAPPLPASSGQGAHGSAPPMLIGAGADGASGEPGPERRRSRRRALAWTLAAILLAGAAAAAVLLATASSGAAVPAVTGETEQSAIAELQHAGLVPSVSLSPSTTAPSGIVVSQNPAHGASVARGSRVGIVVSSGPATTPLESVEGLPAAQALKRIEAQGFKPTRRSQPSSTIPAGHAIGTDPAAGTPVKQGSSVAVLISSGPASVHVPDVTGESRASAEAAITGAGLTVGAVTSRAAPGQTAGSVISQSPHGGASARSGASVTLLIAKAPSEATVPTVVGQTQAQAEAALHGAGFRVSMRTATASEPSKAGNVISQSPTGGRRVRKGSTVTITVATAGSPTGPTGTPTGPTGTTAPSGSTGSTGSTSSAAATPPAGA